MMHRTMSLKIRFNIILPSTPLTILQEYFFILTYSIVGVWGLFLQLIAHAVTYVGADKSLA